MYNEQYYLDRKKDLNDDFEALKNKTFNTFIQIAQNWNIEAQALQKKFQELTQKEAESKKEIAEKDIAEATDKAVEIANLKDKKSAEPKK